MPKSKILGLDWGHKRIGVAISDSDRIMAFSRTSIRNNNKTILEIEKICINENVKLIVLGHPLNMEGEKTKSTLAVEAFAALLKHELKIEVEFHDERLTSRESDSIITSIGIKREDRKKETDIIAASLILKNYLELHRENGGATRLLTIKNARYTCDSSHIYRNICSSNLASATKPKVIKTKTIS